MTRTRLLWTGLVAGAMALGTACSSDMSARRSEPAPVPQVGQPSEVGTGGAGDESGKGNTGVYDDYSVPQEDRGSTGGSGYEDPVTNPDASGTSNSKDKPDVRDQDPSREPGTGGSGYEEDSQMFEESQELGGSRFPGDKAVPQHL
ncbi:hypothetical protein ACN28S_55765 [Cystobacter fuscus]